MSTTTILELHYDAALIRFLDALHDMLTRQAVVKNKAARARDLLLGMGLPCRCTLAEFEPGRWEWVTCEVHEVSYLLLEIEFGS